MAINTLYQNAEIACGTHCQLNSATSGLRHQNSTQIARKSYSINQKKTEIHKYMTIAMPDTSIWAIPVEVNHPTLKDGAWS